MENVPAICDKDVSEFADIGPLDHIDPLCCSSRGAHDILEDAVIELISYIKPNTLSDRYRKDIFEYVQRIVSECYSSCTTFMYGSVLKQSYLPDCDIDIGALVNPNIVPIFFDKLKQHLENESQQSKNNEQSQHIINDITYVNAADVSTIKFVVDNLKVDISANTMTGLSAAIFLEEMNKKIGRDQLFKKSVLVIKAWCTYESRIMASHRSLLSTYALEILILYVVNNYYKSIQSPLCVLVVFLRLLSQFDFEKYVISISGVHKLSAFQNQQQHPDNPLKSHLYQTHQGVFLAEETIEACRMNCTPGSQAQKSQRRLFTPKYFNILDPLDKYNNLGRSVNYSNFKRIKKALARGATEVENIIKEAALCDGIENEDNDRLQLQFGVDFAKMKELDRNFGKKSLQIENSLTKFASFFKYTIQRYGHGHRLDIKFGHPAQHAQSLFSRNSFNSESWNKSNKASFASASPPLKTIRPSSPFLGETHSPSPSLPNSHLSSPKNPSMLSETMNGPRWFNLRMGNIDKKSKKKTNAPYEPPQSLLEPKSWLKSTYENIQGKTKWAPVAKIESKNKTQVGPVQKGEDGYGSDADGEIDQAYKISQNDRIRFGNVGIRMGLDYSVSMPIPTSSLGTTKNLYTDQKAEIKRKENNKSYEKKMFNETGFQSQQEKSRAQSERTMHDANLLQSDLSEIYGQLKIIIDSEKDRKKKPTLDLNKFIEPCNITDTVLPLTTSVRTVGTIHYNQSKQNLQYPLFSNLHPGIQENRNHAVTKMAQQSHLQYKKKQTSYVPHGNDIPAPIVIHRSLQDHGRLLPFETHETPHRRYNSSRGGWKQRNQHGGTRWEWRRQRRQTYNHGNELEEGRADRNNNWRNDKNSNNDTWRDW